MTELTDEVREKIAATNGQVIHLVDNFRDSLRVSNGDLELAIGKYGTVLLKQGWSDVDMASIFACTVAQLAAAEKEIAAALVVSQGMELLARLPREQQGAALRELRRLVATPPVAEAVPESEQL